jgi:hypothetical protein
MLQLGGATRQHEASLKSKCVRALSAPALTELCGVLGALGLQKVDEIR